jgi:hypothetical protein
MVQTLLLGAITRPAVARTHLASKSHAVAASSKPIRIDDAKVREFLGSSFKQQQHFCLEGKKQKTPSR